MRSNKKTLIFLVVALLLFLLLLPLIQHTVSFWPTDKVAYAYPCLDFLKEGTLFTDQPYCGQGSALYVFLYLTRIITGGAFSYAVYLIIFLAMNLHMLFMISRMAEKESGKAEYLFVLIFYTALIYLFARNISSLLAAYFILVGFYITLYSSLKYRNIIGPALVTLGPLTKTNALVVFGVIVVYIIYKAIQLKFIDGKFTVKKGLLKNCLPPILSILAIFFLPRLIWSGSIRYTFGMQAYAITVGYTETILKLISTFQINSGTVFFGILMLLSLYVLFKYKLREPFSIITFISVGALFITLFRQTGFNEQGLIFAISRIDYYLVSLPFFIIAMVKLKQKILLNKNKLIFLILTIAFILFLSIPIELIVSEQDVLSLQKDLDVPFSFIPPQKDRILIETHQGFEPRFEGYYEPEAEIELVPPKEKWFYGDPDSVILDKLEKMGVTKREKWRNLTDEKVYQETFAKLSSDAYSLIVVGPPKWTILLPMVQTANNIKQYCTIILPDFHFPTQQGMHETYLLFREKEGCDVMRPKLNNYFEKSFDDICKRSPFVANNIVKAVMGKQGLALPECTRKTDSLRYYTRYSYHFRLFSLIIGIILTLLCLFNYNSKQAQKS
ncbi:MAG: hypothetical protein KAT43_00545 [Nanoarchaeota archaeon]|nr:hypothetical protein [Nanoarchaeota archaeon]